MHTHEHLHTLPGRTGVPQCQFLYNTHQNAHCVFTSRPHTTTHLLPGLLSPAVLLQQEPPRALELLCPQGKFCLQAVPFPWIHPRFLHKPCWGHPAMLPTLHSLLGYPKGLSSPLTLPPFSPHQSSEAENELWSWTTLPRDQSWCTITPRAPETAVPPHLPDCPSPPPNTQKASPIAQLLTPPVPMPSVLEEPGEREVLTGGSWPLCTVAAGV